MHKDRSELYVKIIYLYDFFMIVLCVVAAFPFATLPAFFLLFMAFVIWMIARGFRAFKKYGYWGTFLLSTANVVLAIQDIVGGGYLNAIGMFIGAAILYLMIRKDVRTKFFGANKKWL
jgi:hypothetical protein